MSGRVGFIGLGNMGGRMTRRFVGAGIPVTGYDTDPGAPARAAADEAASVAELVEATEVVLMSLPDSRVVDAIGDVSGGVRLHES